MEWFGCIAIHPAQPIKGQTNTSLLSFLPSDAFACTILLLNKLNVELRYKAVVV